MFITRTNDDERRIAGETPWGAFDIVIGDDYDGPIFDAAGREIGRVSLAKRAPPDAIGPDEPSGVIAGVARGVAGVVKSAVGVDRATDAVIEARRAVCDECEHAKPCFPGIGRRKAMCCGRLVDAIKPDVATCGCFIRRKTVVATESCPVGKW